MADPKTNIGYGHEDHEKFNKRFEPGTSSHDVVNAPWLSNEAATGLPQVRREFDRNRDPLIAAQLRDLDKSEAERRGEQDGGGTLKKRQDQPQPELKPQYARVTGANGPHVSGHDSNQSWLKAQREAVMAKVPKPTAKDNSSPERMPVFSGPDRN